jgi:hypothetical protein
MDWNTNAPPPQSLNRRNGASYRDVVPVSRPWVQGTARRSFLSAVGLKMRPSSLIPGGEERKVSQPMTIQEAMNKAVAGGYHVQGSDGGATSYSGANSDFSLWTRTDNASSFLVPVEETLLDPAFWTAFGRALAREGVWPSGDWKHLWHQFTEHLINGGTRETFFQTLASPSPPSHQRRGKARS